MQTLLLVDLALSDLLPLFGEPMLLSGESALLSLLLNRVNLGLVIHPTLLCSVAL